MITYVVMGETLSQKKGGIIKNFTIDFDGLIVEETTNGKYVKLKIPFQDIGFDEIVTNEKPYGSDVALFFAVFIIAFLTIALLLETKIMKEKDLVYLSSGLVIGFSIFAANIFKWENFMILSGIRKLSFLYSKKEKKRVDLFVQKIKEQKALYFKENILIVDELLPIEIQKNNFIWLYQTKQINKEEYKALLKELDDLKIIKGE